MELCVAEEKIPSLTASTKETKATGRKQPPRKVFARSSPPHLKNIWAVGQDGCTAKQRVLPLSMWKYPGCAIPTANNILTHPRTWRMPKERFLCPAWPKAAGPRPPLDKRWPSAAPGLLSSSTDCTWNSLFALQEQHNYHPLTLTIKPL